MRSFPAIALAVLLGTPAIAMEKTPSPQRAVPGAGWSALPVSGSSGEQVFHRYCWVCHGDGPDRPGTAALQAKYRGAMPARLDRRTDLNAAFVIFTVRHGVGIMPAARKTEISDDELKKLAAYLARNNR